MTNLMDKLRQLILGKIDNKKPKQGVTMAQQIAQSESAKAGGLMDEASLIRLMHLIEATHQGKYSCAETFGLLDQYVELVVDKKEAALLMPIIKEHLDMCLDCREKYEILLHILQADLAEL